MVILLCQTKKCDEGHNRLYSADVSSKTFEFQHPTKSD